MKPYMPEVVTTSSPTSSWDCSACWSLARRRWGRIRRKYIATGINRKIPSWMSAPPPALLPSSVARVVRRFMTSSRFRPGMLSQTGGEA